MLWLVLALLCTQAWAYYIPGWSIRSYRDGDRIPLFVNKIHAGSTSLPYSYRDLPFVCESSDPSLESMHLNLGEVLRGDRIHESGYNLHQGRKVECETLCTKSLDAAAFEALYDYVDKEYSVEWILDNLPGATAFVSADRSQRYYSAGFPLGLVTESAGEPGSDSPQRTLFYNNHVTLLVRYRPSARDPGRNVIVGFEVYPKSVAPGNARKCPGKKDRHTPLVLDKSQPLTEIEYTYSVYWKLDKTLDWATRWDMYLSYAEQAAPVHWLSVVNSLVIAALLALVVAVILARTLSHDVHTSDGSKAEQAAGGDPESRGWKRVAGDVLRPPVLPTVLAAIVGSGVQLMAMTATVTGFACVGLLNPSYRGGLVSFAVVLFALSGVFGGLVSVRVALALEGQWVSAMMLTAAIVPGALLVIVLVLNLFVWSQASSSALPFGTIVVLLCIWLLLSCPLVALGGVWGARGRKKGADARPTTTPRPITSSIRSSALPTVLSAVAGGLPPFVVIIFELMFIFKSLWTESSGYYYVYGFFALILALLLVTVAEVSVVATYWQLNREDDRWWWRSFWVGTGSAWWVLAYAAYYYASSLRMHSGFIPTLVYFGYTLAGCFLYGLITGTIGFLAAYLFVSTVYGAIKVD